MIRGQLNGSRTAGGLGWECALACPERLSRSAHPGVRAHVQPRSGLASLPVPPSPPGLPKASLHSQEGACFNGFCVLQTCCQGWKQMCVFFLLSLMSERHMLFVTGFQQATKKHSEAQPCGLSVWGHMIEVQLPLPFISWRPVWIGESCGQC